MFQRLKYKSKLLNLITQIKKLLELPLTPYLIQ